MPAGREGLAARVPVQFLRSMRNFFRKKTIAFGKVGARASLPTVSGHVEAGLSAVLRWVFPALGHTLPLVYQACT